MSAAAVHRAPLVHLEDVSFAYDETTGPGFQLRQVSLALHAGELVAIIGQNGSGKTTLARLCNGLLRPSGGRVLVNGNDSQGQSVAELARHVGYLFQNPDHQLFAATVTEDVAFGPRNLGLPPAEVTARVDAILAELDLTLLADRHPLLLSYGSRRLVALAGVLALGSPALVLDEPTAGLDQAHTDRLFQTMHERRRRGAGILLISHDFSLVAAHADRVVVMAGGEMVAEGAPRAILTDAELLAAAGLVPAPVARLARLLAPAGVSPAALSVAELADEIGRVYRRVHGG